MSQPVAQEGHQERSGRRSGESGAHDEADGAGIEPQLGEIDAEEHADEPGGDGPDERGQVNELAIAHTLLEKTRFREGPRHAAANALSLYKTCTRLTGILQHGSDPGQCTGISVQLHTAAPAELSSTVAPSNTSAGSRG